MKKIHHVLYIEYCSMKIKSFASKEAAQRFIDRFLKKRPNQDDYWVDLYFTGTIHQIDRAIGRGR